MDWRHVVLAGAVVLGAGLTAGGWLAGHGFAEARQADRYVTVKGLAERDVTADVALWPIRFVATSDSLAEAQARLAEDAAKVRRFLTGAGIPQSAVRVQSISVTDRFAQSWNQGEVRSRYIVAQTLAVRSNDVNRIGEASQRVGALVQDGVVLSHEGQGEGPVYLYTGLNAIKPAMLAEATRNARAGAEQFARDSGGRVGAIRQASQGVFEILPRDPAPGLGEAGQVRKTVRVVSTVRFDIVE